MRQAAGRGRRAARRLPEPGQARAVGAGNPHGYRRARGCDHALRARPQASGAARSPRPRWRGSPSSWCARPGEGEPCQTDDAGHAYGAACVPGPVRAGGQAGGRLGDRRTPRRRPTCSSSPPTTPAPRSRSPAGSRTSSTGSVPACDLRFVDVPIPQWATELRGEVQSALVRDPGIDYVIPIYDSMSQFAVPAIKAQGAASRVGDRHLQRHALRAQAAPGRRRRADGRRREPRLGRLGGDGSGVPDRRRRSRPVPSEHTPLRVFDRGNVARRARPLASTAGTATPLCGRIRAPVGRQRGGRLATPPVVSARRISKRFAGVRALDDAGLTVAAGRGPRSPR